MIDNKKIFLFQEAKQDALTPVDNNLLKQIDAACPEYWSRDLKEGIQDVVKMDQINFGIAKKIDMNKPE